MVDCDFSGSFFPKAFLLDVVVLLIDGDVRSAGFFVYGWRCGVKKGTQ